MQSNNKFTYRFCLLVHNRFELAKVALNSLLNQTIVDFDVYVSDNSDDPSFSDYIKEICFDHSNLHYIYRNATLNGIEHINKVINESLNYDFFMIFHDDDILHDNYFETIIKLDEINDINLSAIAINAVVLNKYVVSNKKITNYNSNRKVVSKLNLIDTYFCFDSNGAPPFPGYLYRSSLIKDVRLHIENGGKHSDLPFLTDLLSNGYFLWLDKPLMSYRIHESNDSKLYSEVDREKLYNYLIKNHILSSDAKTDFHFAIIIEKYKNKIIRKNLFYFFLLKYMIKAIFEMRFIHILTVQLHKLINSQTIRRVRN